MDLLNVISLIILFLTDFILAQKVTFSESKDLSQNVVQRLEMLEKHLKEMEDREKGLVDEVKTLKDSLYQESSKVRDLEKHLENLETVQRLKEDAELTQKRFLLNNPGSGVAFSSYLDHSVDGIQDDQIIVCNAVLLNEGNGYDGNSGKFTAPVNGVYLFLYFIGNRHDREIDAALEVNRVKQNEAVAEGIQQAHDTQGGNSAIVRLNQGDLVWIAGTLGSHVEGQLRLTSFSGVLLF